MLCFLTWLVLLLLVSACLSMMHIFQAAVSQSFLHLVFIKLSKIYFSCTHLVQSRSKRKNMVCVVKF